MDRTQGSFRVSGAYALRVAVSAATLALAASAHAATPSFVDATAGAGVTWKYGLAEDTGGARMHGGGTVADFNGDGYPDIFVIGGGLDNDRLFINQGDGTFTEEAAAWGLTDLYRGGGAAAGDYDSDGDIDLFVTSMGDMPDAKDGEHKLYRNDGGSFVNVADAAGVAFNHTSNRTGTNTAFDGYSSTWADYDLDGDLDLWFGGWHSKGNPHDTNQTTLYMNNGDGTFTDVTATAGVFDEGGANVGPRAFGGIFADMNGDRYPELLIAGDFGASRYFVNNRDGTFTNLNIFGSNRVHNGMGTAVGDYNRDGLVDWFITAIDPSYLGADNDGNRMYENRGNHTFFELPSADGFDEIGIRDGGWGWGATMKDFDHDGWEDIAHTNGWIIWGDCGESQGREVPPGSCDGTGTDPVTGTQFHNIETRMFKNMGDGTFTAVQNDWNLDHRLQGRGLYQFDYDKDGDLDFVITANTIEINETDYPGVDPADYADIIADTGQFRLYRNDLITAESGTPADANWLHVYLDTSAVNRLAPEGVGALVRVRAGDENGNVRQVYMEKGSNYLGHGETMAHFGLGTNESVQQVWVEWASGFSTSVFGVDTNQAITVVAEEPYTSGTWIRGQTVELVVEGMRPGETVYMFGSQQGLSPEGRCFAVMGGLCLDIAGGQLVGVATANNAGTATIIANVPDADVPPGVSGTMFTQGLIRRGQEGVASLKTNVEIKALIKQ
ncbi:MAG: CRTAC1 family protein [Pseudomonadota bacterium]